MDINIENKTIELAREKGIFLSKDTTQKELQELLHKYNLYVNIKSSSSDSWSYKIFDENDEIIDFCFCANFVTYEKVFEQGLYKALELYTGIDINDIMMRESGEMEKMTKVYQDVSELILSKFGPEGAFTISNILDYLANEDMQNGMKEGLPKLRVFDDTVSPLGKDILVGKFKNHH